MASSGVASAETNDPVVNVTLYTCPTGGWLFGNRHAMEKAIKKEIPGAVVTHKLGYPFTAACEINGKKKREFGPFAFFAPAICHGACCDAKKTGENARDLLGGAPDAVEMRK